MKRAFPIATVLFAGLALAATAGCPGSIDLALYEIDGGEATAETGAANNCPDVPTTVLAGTCGTSGCHDTKPTFSPDLKSPNVTSRLVGVMATGGAGLLINPTNPSESVLYTKLNLPVPYGAQMPYMLPPLPSAEIACVLSWIQSVVSDGGSPGGDASMPPPSEGGTVMDAEPSGDSSALAPLRVACGETTSVMDSQGNTWAADTGSTGGMTVVQSPAKTIANTTSPVLYNAERYGSTTAGFSYAFNVPNGPYAVTLKFAEVFVTGPGQREFNIAINGTTVATNFDIYMAAGGADTAVDETYSVMATAGQIQINFTPGAIQAPKVDAIQIVAGTAADN